MGWGLGVNPNTPAHQSLTAEEQQVLGPRAVPKRRADFARGRWIAKRAVECVLPDLRGERLSILADASGVPYAYDAHLRKLPCSVSISHTERYAAAATAMPPPVVGIDVEHTLANPDIIVRDYFTGDEQRSCATSAGSSDPRLVTAIWALKEATLKALGVGLRVPLQAVQAEQVEEAGGRGTWANARIRLLATLSRSDLAVRAWTRWELDAVVALVAVARGPQPVGELLPPQVVQFDGSAVGPFGS